MTEQPIVWPGTHEESREFLEAASHHCDCQFDASTGVRTKTCEPHALLTDEPALKHLVFGRRIHERLEAEEWTGAPPEGEEAHGD